MADGYVITPEEEDVVVERQWKRITEEGHHQFWMVLACVPHVVRDGYFKPGFDNGFKQEQFREAPGATHLVVHRSIAPRRKTIDDHPYIADGDEYGRFLICATQGPEPEPPVLDGFYSEPLGGADHGLPKAFFVCDTRSQRSIRLPDSGHPILHPNNACLISLSSNAFAVADLLPTVGADHATLLFYVLDSLSGDWKEIELNYPPLDRPWAGNGAFECQSEHEIW